MTEGSRSALAGLHVLVFSKDRACQLDALLRSIRDHLRVPLAGLSILYRASDEEYAKAYRLLASRRVLDRIQWLREDSFREDLLLYLGALPEMGLLMPLVDDDLFHRPFHDTDLLNQFTERHLFISLRCSRRYTASTPPNFLRTEPFLEWRWNYGRRRRLVWNYPFSIDGNVFHVKQFRRAAAALPFRAPNSLEGKLHTYRHSWWVKRVPLALAPAESVLVNIPQNRVQSEGGTWHAGRDPEWYNRAYLAGKRIDTRPLYAMEPTGVHTAHELTLAPCEDLPARSAPGEEG